MPLQNYILLELKALRGAEVFAVRRAHTVWWNARRKDRDEPQLFAGYYWSYRGREKGPFNSPSAAWKDLYFQERLKRPMPLMTLQDLQKADRDIAKAAALAQAAAE